MEVFRGRLVLLDDGLGPATIVTKDGKIVDIVKSLDVPEGLEVKRIVDAGDLILMPGLVDSHVHVNEPGRTEWEGFATATSAAAAGGFTTIVDMPLNSIPPTTTVQNFRTKVKAAEGQSFVDVAFWGGVVPDNVDQLKGLVSAGVRGFKCFLIHSGVDEFRSVTRDQAAQALQELKATGSVLLFHAEVDNCPSTSGDELDPKKYETFLSSRPPHMENEAIKMVVDLCRESGVRCHIVHLASGDAVEMLRKAKFEENLPISVETCHHYLNLNADTVPEGATQFKCCPPVRGSDHQDRLWAAVRDGVVELVVSDHAPCTEKEKLLEKGDFMSAWGGISSLQFGLSLFWTGGKKRGFSLQDVNKFLSRGPAKLAGLQHRKGKIEVGYDADFVIWDPLESLTVGEGSIFHKNSKVTPYMGWKLQGVVHETVVGGKTVFKDGKVSDEPLGNLIVGPDMLLPCSNL